MEETYEAKRAISPFWETFDQLDEAMMAHRIAVDEFRDRCSDFCNYPDTAEANHDDEPAPKIVSTATSRIRNLVDLTEMQTNEIKNFISRLEI